MKVEKEKYCGSSGLPTEEAILPDPEQNAEKKNTSESSDNDKTSGSFGSLFQSNTRPKDESRRNELPDNLFNKEYMSFDEFCSTNSSDNPDTSSGFVNVRLHSRLHTKVRANGKNPRKMLEHTCTVKNELVQNTQSGHIIDTNTQSNIKIQQTLNKDAIAEMDRQYDHNVCLDRFIHAIEHKQLQQEKGNEHLQLPDKAIVKELDKYSNTEALLPNKHTKTSSKTSSGSTSSSNKLYCCSDCSNSSGVCPTCTSGSSSMAPQSNDETHSPTSGSSIESSSSDKDDKSNRNNTNSSDSNGVLPNSGAMTAVKRNSDTTESGIEVNCSSTTTGGVNTSSIASGKNYKGGKLGRKRKRGYIYNPQPVKGKPPKKRIPESNKDKSYWEKRKRNNEAARKSREMRRTKELEISGRFSTMMKENEALRVAISLLIKRNDTLENILGDYFVAEKEQKGHRVSKVPVTC